MTAPHFLGLVCLLVAAAYSALMVRDWRRHIERRRAERLIARLEARP